MNPCYSLSQLCGSNPASASPSPFAASALLTPPAAGPNPLVIVARISPSVQSAVAEPIAQASSSSAASCVFAASRKRSLRSLMVQEDTPPATKLANIGTQKSSKVGETSRPPKFSPKLKCVPKEKKMEPKDQIVGRRYSTRSTKLISRLDDSLLITKETTDRDSSSRDSDGYTDDLSSRRARLSLIEPEVQVDLSFSDFAPSAVSHFAFGKSGPSTEALFHAKSAVKNFLKLGLHQLEESQRLAMLSSVSILRMSPEFDTSEFCLLDSLPAIFFKSDSSLAVSADRISQRKSFQVTLEEKENLDKHKLVILDQISNVMAIYDDDVVEVQRLKAKLAASLDKAETLERELLANRNHSRRIGQKLLNLKDDYQMWTKTLQEAEATQSDCLAKWEKLQALFQV